LRGRGRPLERRRRFQRWAHRSLASIGVLLLSRRLSLA
jgi:hypothetical protein